MEFKTYDIHDIENEIRIFFKPLRRSRGKEIPTVALL